MNIKPRQILKRKIDPQNPGNPRCGVPVTVISVSKMKLPEWVKQYNPGVEKIINIRYEDGVRGRVYDKNLESV